MGCDRCPLANSSECKSYPALCDNFARNPDRWRPVLDMVNGRGVAGPTTEYPPLATQAANAVKAAARFVGSGFATVDRAEFDRRRSICEACDRFDAARNRCRACGCRLDVKPWSAKEKCPEGKW